MKQKTSKAQAAILTRYGWKQTGENTGDWTNEKRPGESIFAASWLGWFHRGFASGDTAKDLEQYLATL